MLHLYDKVKSSSLLAIAAAGTVFFAPMAIADTSCYAADGYGASVAAYVTEASACIEASGAIRGDFVEELLARTNRDRAVVGLSPLVQRDSLNMAAQAHAIDMAARDYADHADKEGRDHLFRIRAFDRSVLVGSTGANVLITETGADAGDIYVAMQEDSYNADNLVRDGFTDVGIAVVKDGGQAYTVMVFAQVEGELNEALPLTLAGVSPIRATLAKGNRETIGWGLTDQASGEVLAKGKAQRVRATRLGATQAAALDLVVTAGTDQMILKGPLVSAQ
jgi:uncharacterized protein YkwD